MGIEGDVERTAAVAEAIDSREAKHLPPGSPSLFNQPVSTPSGLEMQPLSWFVFGNHAAAVRRLLEFERVDVNAVFLNEGGDRITALDVAELLFKNRHGERFDGAKGEEYEGDAHWSVCDSVRKRGGKTAVEIELFEL